MNEEEREIVKKFEKLYLKDFNNEKITNEDKLSYIECALMTNLIEKLQKENEELKYKIKGQECVIETQVHNEEVYESIFEKLEKENKELKNKLNLM